MFFANGWWVIFAIVGLACMLLMVSRMLGLWGHGTRHGTGMGMMGQDRDPDRERDESAMEVLRRRYAADELTDEEFDAKRRRLEGP